MSRPNLLREPLRRNKTHIVSLSFDDGFKKSFYEVAEIYEEFGLRACLNVIAIGHEQDFQPLVNGRPDARIVPFPKGDWDDWNKLKKRGHEVMAHTYNHQNLTTVPLEEAKALIVKCAEVFESRLKGFKASQSVYNFAYNASTPPLDAFALTKFLVVRTQGDTPVNPIPHRRVPVRIGCFSHGPDSCDQFLNEELNKFLKSPGGWFVFNTHGLDTEGWGPMSSNYLRSTLARLVKMPQVEVLPVGEVVLRLRP
jgi:peptidoglycan/xylan/chitin deacetylase (PgdA/CDA1 family)